MNVYQNIEFNNITINYILTVDQEIIYILNQNQPSQYPIDN